MSYIPYGRQDISEEDIEAVVTVLKSDFLTQGSTVPSFEKALTDYCDVKFSVAVNSATSALHIACLALGVGEGDVVWTTPITFVASANCALYCGAEVDFVDIDPVSYNMSVEQLSLKLQKAHKNKKLPRVIIAVHLCGQPCEMKAIHELADKYGVKIIEDASHAIGGKYCGKPIGNCQYSDITVFSFHPVKIITTGEGGLATTNNKQLAKRMVLLRSHGITRSEDELVNRSDGEWYYEQKELGYNYRMTDIQAALGCSQIKRLDEFVATRHKIANRYGELMKDLPLELPRQHEDSYSGYHLYVIRLKLDEISKTHKEVFTSLREAKIGVNLHYIPVYKQPYYKQLGFDARYCPEAEKYYSEAISLPLFPQLKSSEQSFVVSQLTSIIS